MSRKFWTSYNALIANYSANQNVNQFTYGAGTWTESTLINAPPYGGNLISMSIGAATIGNARCLKTAYDSGAVVPFTCTNGVWSVGSPITSPAGGNPASVAISFDGMHALAGGDWMSGVGAYKFNSTTGLWVANGAVSIPESHTNSVAISPDGLRGMCCTKWGSNAYPLYRNSVTNVWSAGSALTLGAGSTRFFCCSFDPTGTVCLIGGNADGILGTACFWDGSSWTRATVPLIFAASRWLADGTTVLAVSGNASGRYILVLNYDPGTKTFTVMQTVTVGGGNADLWGISVPELGRQDIAIVTLFYSNQILPLTRTGSTWSAGTPITSPNLTWPLASVIMPLLA